MDEAVDVRLRTLVREHLRDYVARTGRAPTPREIAREILIEEPPQHIAQAVVAELVPLSQR